MALTKISGNVIKDSVSLAGNVSIGGTLTYQDVTNIDAVGLITARTGIKVLGGGINAVGVVTATSFVGALPISNDSNNRVITATGSGGLNGEANLTYDGTTLNIIDSASGSGSHRLTIGNSHDLRLYHDGNSTIGHYGDGDLYLTSENGKDLYLRAADDIFLKPQGGENGIIVTGNGSVALFYDNVSMLETEARGSFVKKADGGETLFTIGSTNAGGVRLALDGDSNGDATGFDYAYLQHNSSGDLIISADNPAGNSNLIFQAGNSSEYLRITPAGNVQLNNYSGSAGKGRISFGNSGPAFIEGIDSGNAGSGAYLRFQVNNTEKVRIPRDTWGLLVTNQGSTGNTGGYQTNGVSLRHGGDSTMVHDGGPPLTLTRKTNAGKILDFYNGTSYAGGVYVNGQNSAQYQSTSDYRLKDNVSSMSDGISKVKQLNPIYYTNKLIGDVTDTTTTQNGFLAHEIQTVLPTLVDGEKDGDVDERGKGYQTMDYAGLTPTLTAAIKELIAKVETLEAEVAALKGS